MKKTQCDLIVLPTLDGSKEAAIARLEAWSTKHKRRAMADEVKASVGLSSGQKADLLDMLDVIR